MPETPRPPLRSYTFRLGPLGCALSLVVAIAIGYLLLPLLIALAALPVAFVLFFWARTKLLGVFGIRRERCPGCGGTLRIRRRAESVTCARCGMIHVFRASESRAAPDLLEDRRDD